MIPTYIISTLITFMYFTAGLKKIGTFGKTVESLQKRLVSMVGMKLPQVLAMLTIVVVIVLEVVGPVAIFRGYYMKTSVCKKRGRMAALALAIFTVLATLLYHSPPTGSNWYPFVANMSAIGGLLLVHKTI